MVKQTHQPRPAHVEQAPCVDPGKQIFRDFRTGVCLSIAMAILAVMFEQTPPGERLRLATYHLLERLLTPADDLPITVIDISGLEPDKRTGVTSRDALKRLLRVVVNRHPKAVGIDVDFSPQDGKLLTDKDQGFFDYCLTLSRNEDKPIFLGISRTENLPPDQWLGIPDYGTLAAAILVPSQDTRSFPRWFGAYRGRTMSAALADAYGQIGAKDYPTWLLENISEKDVYGVHVEEIPVDYSVIKTLAANRLLVDDKGSSTDAEVDKILTKKPDPIAGKMVLIGDATVGAEKLGDSDVFPNPLDGSSVRGILLHASAAYTSATHPLFDIREPWRTCADLILAVALLTVIMLVRLFLDDTISGSRLLLLLTVVMVILVLAVGLEINHTRVLWDGFLLVAIALSLHPFVEEPFLHVWHGFNKWIHRA